MKETLKDDQGSSHGTAGRTTRDNKTRQDVWQDHVMEDNGEALQIWNPSSKDAIIIPKGLSLESNFWIPPSDQGKSWAILNKSDDWEWQGYLQRQRVLKYHNIDDIPEYLIPLVTQIHERATSKSGSNVSVPSVSVVSLEQYPITPMGLQPVYQNSTSFENKDLQKVSSVDENYYVAHLVLSQNFDQVDCHPIDCTACDCSPSETLQQMDRPVTGTNGWKLQAPLFYFQMNANTLYIKKSEALVHWRSRITRPPPQRKRRQKCHVCQNSNKKQEAMTDNEDVVTILRVTNVPTTTTVKHTIPNLVTPPRTLSTMPPLSSLLTILVTTSPIQSNPSTEMLERTFETFSFCGPDFVACPKLIVCDGVRIYEDEGNGKNLSPFNTKNNLKTTKKTTTPKQYSTVKQSLRNGIVTQSQDLSYEEFKQRLKLVTSNSDEYPFFAHTTIHELHERHGYGFALREGLALVKTPYVCVIQHDRTFMRPTPMRHVVQAMWESPEIIKYVGMSMRSNLQYRDIFCTKYGKTAHEELSCLIKRPTSLNLSNDDYDRSSSVRTMLQHVSSEKLRENLKTVAAAYLSGSRQAEGGGQTNSAATQLTLTPTVFWYDNTHVVLTNHYRDFILNPQLKMVTRGGFVEETTSPMILQSVERHSLTRGHEKFGCFLLDDHSGYFFTGHLDGGNYQPSERIKCLARQANKEGKRSAESKQAS